MEEKYVHAHCKWYAKETRDILERLETDPEKGLSAAEVRERTEQFGLNVLPGRQRESAFIRFIKHFHDILIYILFAAALVTLVLGHYADTAVIFAVAVINAAIGFFQESKAEKALDSIMAMLSDTAMVIRDGVRQEVSTDRLTLGDIVLLSPGEKVPADLRLLRAERLKIDEAALTGESEPVEKQVLPVEYDAVLAERSNMAYSGTAVSNGTGLGVVVDMGEDTEIGRISQLMEEMEPETTPLIRQTQALGKTVALVIVAASVAVYLFGHFFRDYAPTELLLSTIGLAIAAIPEGLPAIMSIILAIGVQNMAKRNAIVRNLPSVETLGSVSVICSDKTGTLTRNEMTVQRVVTGDAAFDVSGSGYAPKGEILDSAGPVDVAAAPGLEALIRCLRECNEASLAKDEDGQWIIHGDPTEGALVTLYEKSGLGPVAGTRLDSVPFDSEHKYMAVLVRKDEDRFILVKGAPDRLLAMASQQQGKDGPEPLNGTYWKEAVSALASRGMRVLGAAMRPVATDAAGIDHDDVERGLIFLGLAGIVDPPREEAIEAVRVCREAGIRVKMITGDHEETARAIGNQLGIGDGETALSGRELDDMTPHQLHRAIHKYDIFARTSPEHKLRLVEALQATGCICGMTGDGVNDAPALRKADVGIAMGIKGTDVTKEAAEIVLADDNFKTIEAAVEEGRRVYDNLKKTILFILPTNGAESFLIIAAILFGTMIPLTPVQILWVNMVTSVTVSLALAFEKAEPGVMKRVPRQPGEKLINGYFAWRILFVSVLIGGMVLIMNELMLRYGYREDMVRTTTMQAIVMCQLFHLFNSRSIREPAFCMDFFSNKAVFVVCGLLIVLQLAVTYLPVMNRLFGTVPLPVSFWCGPIVLGAAVFFTVEGEKAVMRRLDREGSARALVRGLFSK